MALNLGKIFYQLGVQTSGLNQASKHVKTFQSQANRSFDSVNNSANLLKQTIGTVITVETLRRATMLADEYALLKDRVNAVVGDVDKATLTFAKLQKISAKTGATLTTTAGGFQKLSFAKETVRATDEEMIKLTQSFAELGLISGTSTQLLDAAMLQFSQGLVTGTFQAQEFQSVMENVPAILPQIAAGMGVTTQEVIKMKKEGRLVSEQVFRALVNQADEISVKAAEMPIRLSRGFARFTLGIQQSLAGLDETNGLTLKLGRLFFETGEQIARLPMFVEAMTKTISDMVGEGERISGIVRALTLATTGMIAFSVATKTASVAMALLTKLNPFMIIATSIIYVIDQTISFQKAIGVTIGFLKGLLDFGKQTFTSIIELVSLTSQAMNELATFQFDAAKATGQRIKDLVKNDSAAIAQTVMNAKNQIQGILDTEDYKVADEGGLLGKVFNFDPAQLDIVKSFQDNMAEVEMAHNERMAAIRAKAANDQIKQAEEKSYLLVKIEEWKNKAITSFQMNAGKKQTDNAGKNFRNQIDQAAQYSKEFAALSKALALFDLVVKTPQAIGNAFTWGTSVGGPIVGAAMSATAGAAMGVQMAAVASQSFTPRAVGGDVFPNQTYLVGENGPELLNLGNQRGNISPNGDFGSMMPMMGKPSVTVNVYPIEGETATIRQSEDGQGGLQIDVLMEQVDNKVAQGIQRGTSQVSQSIANTFGLNRAIGAAI
jgi:tape measure domain-containing protein